MTLVCRYYDNYLEGEFILYKHKTLPYEVWFMHYGLCISSNKNKYLKRRKIKRLPKSSLTRLLVKEFAHENILIQVFTNIT